MRYAPCFWLTLAVAGLTGCDELPSVDYGDGGADTSVEAGPTGTIASGLAPYGSLRAPGSVGTPPPSESWTDPPSCPTVHEDAHCEECWEHDDGGETSLGRELAGDRFAHVIAVGDFNGDGYPDVASGIPRQDGEDSMGGTVTESGAVQVLLGSSRGFQRGWCWTTPPTAGRSRRRGSGLSFWRWMSTRTATTICWSATRDTSSTTRRCSCSWGSPSGLTYSDRWHLSDVDNTTQSQSHFGNALAAGDLDHDGDIDVAIGAWKRVYGGTVYVLENDGSGTLSLDYEIQVTSSRFGHSLAVTSAGLLVVGDYGKDEVRTYDDATLVDTFTSGYTPPMVDYGYRVEVADLDSDGTDEIFVGGRDDWIEIAESGGTSGNRIYPPSGGTGAARTFVTTAGDITRDGFVDLVFIYAAPGNQNSMFILEGNDTLSRSCWDVGAMSPCWFELDPSPSPTSRDDLGERVEIVDVDGDGFNDLVVGVPYPEGGKIFVYAPDSSTTWDDTLTPDQELSEETPLEATCEVCDVFDDGYECDGSTSICVFDQCVLRGCGDGWREEPGRGAVGVRPRDALQGDLARLPTGLVRTGGDAVGPGGIRVRSPRRAPRWFLRAATQGRASEARSC